jgi:hypothetical protein
MNNNDLAALAALGAMGYMYKRHLDSQGTEVGPADAAGSAAGYEGVVPSSELGSQGNFRFGDAARDAGTTIRESNRALAGEQRGNSGVGLRLRGGNEQRYRDNRGGGGGGGGGGGKAAGYTDVVPGSELGSQGNFRFSTPEVVPDVAPEESGGMGAAGIGAAGLGAAGAGAAAYYAKVKAQARAIDEARARMKAEAQRGILADRAQAEVNEDRAAAARAQNEADRAAKAQAEAEAEAKSRATQAEIDAELKKYKQKAANVKNDRIPVRPAVMNKEAWAAGPTVTTASNTAAPRENAARMTAAQKAAAKQAADMEAFNKQLRETKVGLPEAKVGPAETTTSGKGPRSMKGAATPAALAAMAVLAAAPDIASAGVQTYKGDTSGALQSLKDSKEALKALAMLPVDVSRAAMKGDFGPLKDLAMSMNPGTLLFNETSKHDEEAIKRMIEREKAAASKKAGGGQIKAKKMASGGMTSKVSSASKRGDGIASKGKTRCKLY